MKAIIVATLVCTAVLLLRQKCAISNLVPMTDAGGIVERTVARITPGTSHFRRSDPDFPVFPNDPLHRASESQDIVHIDPSSDHFERFAKRVELPDVLPPDFASRRPKNCGEYVAAAILAGLGIELDDFEFQKLGETLNVGAGVSAPKLKSFLESHCSVSEATHADAALLCNTLDHAGANILVLSTENEFNLSTPHWAAITGYVKDREGEVVAFRVVDNGTIGEWISHEDLMDRWSRVDGGWYRYALTVVPENGGQMGAAPKQKKGSEALLGRDVNATEPNSSMELLPEEEMDVHQVRGIQQRSPTHNRNEYVDLPIDVTERAIQRHFVRKSTECWTWVRVQQHCEVLIHPKGR